MLLPPATKLGQGNVFTGVCDSVNGGISSRGGWSWGVGGPGPGGGCLVPGGCLVLGGLLLGDGGVPGGDPPGMATAAGNTHPTGMHSCLNMKCLKNQT